MMVYEDSIVGTPQETFRRYWPEHHVERRLDEGSWKEGLIWPRYAG